jgi:hypothetical protein
MLQRKITEEDLRDKGYPFECDNCGNKPTPEDVVKYNGQCNICGYSIITYTVDTAEYIIKMGL